MAPFVILWFVFRAKLRKLCHFAGERRWFPFMTSWRSSGFGRKRKERQPVELSASGSTLLAEQIPHEARRGGGGRRVDLSMWGTETLHLFSGKLWSGCIVGPQSCLSEALLAAGSLIPSGADRVSGGPEIPADLSVVAGVRGGCSSDPRSTEEPHNGVSQWRVSVIN